MNRNGRTGPFHVGQRVWVQFGTLKAPGTVVEHRTPYVVHGKHAYGVEVFHDPFEPSIIGRTEDGLEPIPEGVDPEPMPGKAQVINYLKCGGLIAILHANEGRVDDQPRAWLRPDSAGNVTRTFAASRGKVGGAPIPFHAVRDFKILADKRPQVVEYLTTFGLTREEAEDVVKAVGVKR